MYNLYQLMKGQAHRRGLLPSSSVLSYTAPYMWSLIFKQLEAKNIVSGGSKASDLRYGSVGGGSHA